MLSLYLTLIIINCSIYYISQKMNLISTLVLCDQEINAQNHPLIEQSEEIDELLTQILLDDVSILKQTYSVLQTVLSILQRKKGPNSFQKLLNQIFNFVKRYTHDRIRSYKEEIVILNLTYYEKISKQYLNSSQKLEILIMYIIANIHAYLRTSQVKKLNSIGDKLQEVSNIKIQGGHFENTFGLLVGIFSYLKSEYKKARTLLANLFTKIITEKKQTFKEDGYMEIMAISAFYSYLNLTKLEEFELSYYYLTKANEFAKNLGQNSEPFLNKIKEICQYKSFRIVKLTRIENNLQVLNRKTKSWHSKTMKSKIYLQKKQVNHQMINQQLQNIFTIKDTKATMYKFRKDNLRYLNKEQNKLESEIKNRQNQLQQIHQMRNQLYNKTDIIQIQQTIKQLQAERKKIKSQCLNLKQKYLAEVRPIKLINSCFKTFLIAETYSKEKSIYNFLYGQMISRTKLFVLSWMLKRKTKNIKRNVKYMKIYYDGLLYFIELFQIIHKDQISSSRKKQPGFYIKIYPLEKEKQKIAINDEKKISEQVYEKLKEVPFYYEFNVVEGKLISFNQYLSSKSMKIVYCVKKFIQIISLKYKEHKKYEKNSKIQKLYIRLQFGGQTSIELTLLAFVNKLRNPNLSQSGSQSQISIYETQIYTIGGPKYFNPIYNLKIDKVIQIEENGLSQEEATLIVRNQLMKVFEQNIESVKTVQRFIKLFHSKRQISKLKRKNCISVFVQGHYVISFCKYAMGKSIIVAENILTKERASVETIMDCNSFHQIKYIKDKLEKEKSCSDKIKIACRFIWTKFFICKLKDHYRGASVLTDFQISFRNRIIFSKIYPSFIYNKQQYNGKIIVSLIVESLFEFPRPYILRIFSYSRDCIPINIREKIFNRQKLFYEHNILFLNKMINIISTNEFEIMEQNEESDDRVMWNTRQSRNSKNSRNSRNSKNSRNSRNSSLRRSIISYNNDDEVKQLAGGTQIMPKFASKKSSMLLRFKNRKSNQTSPNICIQKVDRKYSKNQFPVYTESPKKSEESSFTSNCNKSKY